MSDEKQSTNPPHVVILEYLESDLRQYLAFDRRKEWGDFIFRQLEMLRKMSLATEDARSTVAKLRELAVICEGRGVLPDWFRGAADEFESRLEAQ